jgi:hypothetical protein
VTDRSTMNLPYLFEQLVEEIFQFHQFLVVRVGGPGVRDLGYDFALDGTPTKAVVEAKLYRSLGAQSANISQALERLESSRLRAEAEFGILVTNSRLTALQKSRLQRYSQLRIYDYDILAALAAQEPGLARRFEEITREALTFRGEDLPNPAPVEMSTITADLGLAWTLTESHEPVEPPAKGKALCDAIHAVPETVSKPFEVACSAAVRYLFADHLVAFDDQHGSHTKMHFFDLVARIASTADFWQALITDFRARYIVFEFKNYKKEITQREIYTTEKYLYPIAMRGAAIIISRHGADQGADKAMRGALRESGKLILSLSVSELCQMLEARDKGSDHLALLVDKLDAMLMGLER